MSASRPLLIALAAVVLLGGALLVTRGGSDGDSGSGPATTSATEAQTGADTGADGSGAQGGASGTGGKAEDGDTDTQTGAGGAGGGAGTSSGGNDTSAAGNVPPRVKKALDANKVLLLLFWDRRGSDDRAVKRAVDGISTRGGAVAKFTDKPENVDRYVGIVGTGGVMQAPTVVVVSKSREATIETGYLDRESVDQLVVDALRAGRS